MESNPPLLSVFGRKGRPQGLPKSIKIDEKSMQQSMGNSAGFLRGLGSVFSSLWEPFLDPGPSILRVSSRRGAIFQNFVFLRFGLIFCRFGDVLGWFGEPFW